MCIRDRYVYCRLFIKCFILSADAFCYCHLSKEVRTDVKKCMLCDFLTSYSYAVQHIGIVVVRPSVGPILDVL